MKGSGKAKAGFGFGGCGRGVCAVSVSELLFAADPFDMYFLRGEKMFNFDNTYSRLPEQFYARVAPAKVPEPALIKWNEDLARELGIQSEQLTDRELAEIFAGRKLLPGSEPIALAYAGHQFGQFVPRLGDGRALLLGEILDPSGKRFDIQLKGSGRTPFSRQGDGKAPLGPVLREYIVSEGLHHLGLPTTRSLAAVRTGETVYREKALPGAILTRVAASHIRIGTFEYFAARNDRENLKTLADYAIQRHYPEIRDEADSYFHFFRKVGRAQIELVTGWMALGFIHGVMNTDNMSVTGESIDFGPCAFMDQFRSDRVFSSIDRFGRYSYSNQVQITLWNLSRLGSCLIHLADRGTEDTIESYNTELESLGTLFDRRLTSKMLKKIGILNDENPEDQGLLRQWLDYLEKHALDYTLSFRNLAGLVKNDSDSGFFEKTGDFQAFYENWKKRIRAQDRHADAIREGMNSVNPLYIPRNHMIERVIAAALEGDFGLFHEMNAVLEKPYEEQERFNEYLSPPEPHEVVRTTFCGT